MKGLNWSKECFLYGVVSSTIRSQFIVSLLFSHGVRLIFWFGFQRTSPLDLVMSAFKIHYFQYIRQCRPSTILTSRRCCIIIIIEYYEVYADEIHRRKAIHDPSGVDAALDVVGRRFRESAWASGELGPKRGKWDENAAIICYGLCTRLWLACWLRRKDGGMHHRIITLTTHYPFFFFFFFFYSLSVQLVQL